MVKQQVYILNAPPAAGKDTIGQLIQKEIDCTLSEFKKTLYEATADFFNVNLENFKIFAKDTVWKEIPMLALCGLSPREAMIKVSEKVLKPLNGKDYFAIKALEQVKGTVTIFTDGGFQEEVDTIGKEHFTRVIQLHGRGTFENDSRKYIESPSGIETTRIKLVDNRPELAVMQIMQIIKHDSWLINNRFYKK